MSTEASPDASPARSAIRRSRRWRRSVIAVLAVLALAVAGLTTGAALRGPRVTGVEYDRAALVQRDGGRVVVELDQQLRGKPRVAVAPAVTGLSFAVSGRSIAITFPRMLDYDRAYRLRVLGAVGASTGVRADLDVTVRTADAQVYALVREPGGTDRIVRRALGGGPLVTVYAARRIQRYAVLPAQLAVVTVDRTGNGRLVTVPTDGSGRADPVTGPEGAIDSLSASGPSGLLSYTVSSTYGATADDAPADDATADDAATDGPLADALLVLDPTDGSGVAQEVRGAGDGGLSAVQTQWIPGTTSLVARADDGSLSLVDAAARTASPSGSASELRGVVPGSALLVLADPDGGRTLDLSSGRQRPLDLRDDELGDVARSAPIVLDRAGRYLEVVSETSADFTRRAFRIVEVEAGRARVLWKPALTSTRIDRICLSPNAQYVSVETVPAGAPSDDYPGRPLSPATSTSVVDLGSGEATRSLPGADPSWCSAGASADG